METGTQERASAGTKATAPRTKAFFFQSSEQPLFGLYGPPSSGRDLDHAVLLCPPVGHEYHRAHWGLRLLGDQLIEAGLHVLRFDYSCTGDSWGEFEAATVEQWLADVKTALTELQDNAGVRKISVVGLRLGATLACAAAADYPLHRVVLWEPVPSGDTHLEESRSLQRRLRQTWAGAPLPVAGAAYEELLGYRYSAALIEGIRRLELGGAGIPQAEHVSFVLSADAPRWREFEDRLRKNRVSADTYLVSDVGTWAAVDDDLYVEPLLLPRMRQEIVNLLGEPE